MKTTGQTEHEIPEAEPCETLRGDQRKILRAKPVEGPIDWAELSRGTIARYPNILKRLAER